MGFEMAFVRFRYQPKDWLIKAAEAVGVNPTPYSFFARESLPAVACLYFVDADGVLLYLGASENIRKRWRSHHHAFHLAESSNRIWVIETPKYRSWERPLIRHLCPRWNDSPPPGRLFRGGRAFSILETET